MTVTDRIAYAERELERAKKEVAAAERFLQSALEQARHEQDEADKALMRPGALIAEFDGKLHVAMRHASIDIERHVQDLGDRVITTGRTAELRCSCGVQARWSLPPDSAPVVYRYFRDACETSERRYHLVIVRSAGQVPPCEHWMKVPLTLDESSR